MLLFSTLFLATISIVQGLIIPRDAASVISSLDEITTRIHSLGELVQTFNGTFNQTLAALEIQGQTGELSQAIDSAITTINAIQPLNENDSVQVIYVVAALQTDIYDLLDLLVAKKPAFDTAILGIGSVSFLVRIDLQVLRASTAELGDLIVSKLLEELQRLGPLVTTGIDYHFSEAIQAFS